jgi:hypothetical protein
MIGQHRARSFVKLRGVASSPTRLRLLNFVQKKLRPNGLERLGDAQLQGLDQRFERAFNLERRNEKITPTTELNVKKKKKKKRGKKKTKRKENSKYLVYAVLYTGVFELVNDTRKDVTKLRILNHLAHFLDGVGTVNFLFSQRNPHTHHQHHQHYQLHVSCSIL